MGTSSSKHHRHDGSAAPPSVPEEVVRTPHGASDVLRRVTYVDEALGSSVDAPAPDGFRSVPTQWTNHHVLFAERDIDAPTAAVEAMLADFKRMPEYDPDLREAKVVAPAAAGSASAAPPGTEVVRISLNAINPVIGARDFATIHASATNVPRGSKAEYSYVAAFADAGSLVPHAAGHVRGTCHSYGFTVRAAPGLGGKARSRVGCVMCFDLGGWLPNSLADKGGPAMCHLLENLAALCEKTA